MSVNDMRSRLLSGPRGEGGVATGGKRARRGLGVVRVEASGEQSVPDSMLHGCARVVHDPTSPLPSLARQERHAVDRGTPSQAFFDTGL